MIKKKINPYYRLNHVSAIKLTPVQKTFIVRGLDNLESEFAGFENLEIMKIREDIKRLIYKIKTE